MVKSSDSKSLTEISSDVKSLVTKAREKTLKPEEFMGGTFTISNLGGFGVSNFSAVINPPQTCILAIGSTEKQIKVNPEFLSGESENMTRIESIMKVTLSCDHRVVDGAIGAKWLQAFKNSMEEPLNLLL